MARLTAAFGSSHSVMLTCELEDWISRFKDRDDRLPFYDPAGNDSSWQAVLARAPANAASLITPSAITRRFEATQQAMERMKTEIASAKLDVLIIVGDDQYELFHDDHMPSIGIYYGETIRNAAKPTAPEPDWYKRAQIKRREAGGAVTYPCHAPLATYLIEGLVGRGFDISAMKGLAENEFEGHAYSFIHYRYLHDNVVPIIPVFLNTYNPPNQPTPPRCVALGHAFLDLIESFPGDLRVGIMASGGLSHFLVEEELDRGVIDAIRRKDLAFLAGLDPRRLQAGSSEIRSWMVAAAAAKHLELSWEAYIPGYRTLALSGTGLGFARWS